jgi:hypothetical protein
MMQKMMKRNNTDIILVGQQCMQFNQGCIGMIGNELSDLCLVGRQFQLAIFTAFLGGDVAGFFALFSQGIHPRNTDRILSGDIFGGHSTIVIFQYSFSQINRIGAWHIIIREEKTETTKYNDLQHFTPYQILIRSKLGRSQSKR